jgi:hypothetical protein
MTAQFEFCEVELDLVNRVVTTRFFDGTFATAIPHDTPEYHAHALEKTGLDDVMRYCWQHELMHVIVAQMKGRPSAVLWGIAHGKDLDTLECHEEEETAQKLQRAFQMTL